MPRARSGSALIEAIVALLVLGLAAAGLLGALAQAQTSVRSARSTERRIDSASAELARLVALDARALQALSGWTTHRDWAVHVTALGPSLFEAAVAHRVDASPVVATIVYRPDSGSADARP